MSLTLDENPASYQIRSYEPGQIQVNDLFFDNSIVITPNKFFEYWLPQHVNALEFKDFACILELKPLILLLGTGEKLTFPPLSTYGELINYGIGVEIMDTRAACRTYNALAAEGRDVAAALIIR